MNGIEHPVMVGIGEVLWDLLPDGKRFGGAPANFTCHARSLGAEAYLVSSVGSDEMGEELLQRLDDQGVNRDHVAVDAEHPTGTVSVTLDRQGVPQYVIHEPVAWDFIPPRPSLVGLADLARVVCFGSLAQRQTVSRVTIRDFLAATRNECLRIFDVNLRQSYYNIDTIAVGLAAATVVKLNGEEFGILCRMLSIGGSEREALGTMYRRYGLQLIVLTKGPEGSVLVGPEGYSVHPGMPAEVADTVGAGDAFTAVIAMGLVRGLPLEVINEHANRVAAYVCSQPGATPPLPPQLARLPEP